MKDLLFIKEMLKDKQVLIWTITMSLIGLFALSLRVTFIY